METDVSVGDVFELNGPRCVLGDTSGSIVHRRRSANHHRYWRIYRSGDSNLHLENVARTASEARALLVGKSRCAVRFWGRANCGWYQPEFPRSHAGLPITERTCVLIHVSGARQELQIDEEDNR